MPPAIAKVGQDDFIRHMLYSFPGWGKTSYLGTAAAAGMKALLIRSPMDQVPARILQSGTDEVIVKNWEDMTGGDGILDFLRYSQHGYEWVFFDSISIIQDVLLDDVWAGVIADKPGRAFKLDDSGKITGPNLSPTSGLDRGEYGRNMERLQQFIRHIVGVNAYHFVITAHPHEGQHPSNDEGGFLLRPWIQGKNMTEKFCGYCNMVSFMEVIEEDDDTLIRRMHFRESPRYYAKDLFDAFPDGYLDDPTIPKVLAAVEAAKTGKNGKPSPRRRGGRRKTTR